MFSFLNLANSLSFSFVTFVFLINNSLEDVLEITSRVPSICNKVVLPAPEEPTIETISFSLI